MEPPNLFPSSRSTRQHHNNSSNNLNNTPTVTPNSRNNIFQQQYNNSSSVNTHLNLGGSQNESLSSASNFTNQFNFPLRSNRNFSSQKSSQQVHKSRGSRQSQRGDSNHPNINEGQQQEEQPVEHKMSSPPVYRIFKRGDNIPGITNPLCLQTTMNNGQNNEANITTNSSTNNNSSHSISNIQLENNCNNESVIGSSMIQPPQSSLHGLELINHHQQQEGGLTSLSNNTSSTFTTLESDSGSTTCSTSESNSQQSMAKSNRTPISIIGDIARFHGLTAENYHFRLTNETGPPHAPTFTVVLVLGNEQYQAQGSSIKKAQLSAAAMAVEKTSLTRPPLRAQPKKAYNQSGGGFHPKRTNWTIMQLNTLAEELNETLSFTAQPVIMNPYGRTDPPSLVVVHVGEKVFTGEGANFNAAKNQAAVGALKSLLEMKRERELLKMAESGNLPDSEIDTDGKSPISVCHEMALKRGLHVSFEVKGEVGPPHLKVFTVQCIVGDLSTDGNGPTKQQAKKSSCELMIIKLRDIPLKLPKSTGISLKAIQKGLKPKTSRKKPSTPVVKEVDKQIVSPISRLLQIAHVKKYREPEFSIVLKSEGSAEQSIGGKNGHRNKKKKPIFTMEVKIGPHVCQGTGPNKKQAKKAAADAALVLLGYTPTATTDSNLLNNSNGNATSDNNTVNTTNDDATTKAAVTKDSNDSIYKNSPPLTAYRQIVPGVLIIKNSGETNGQMNSSSTTPAHVAQAMNSMSQPTLTSKSFDGIGKLSYLAELLGVSVSYSDFPKKNEFLSVVSIGTNPPHVAHGTGPTREEAQNSAALQILDELSISGLDDSTTSTLSNSSDCNRVPIKSD